MKFTVSPLQFDLQQAHIYCDPELVLEEGCCEILPGGVSGAQTQRVGVGTAQGYNVLKMGWGSGRGLGEVLDESASVLIPVLPLH